MEGSVSIESGMTRMEHEMTTEKGEGGDEFSSLLVGVEKNRFLLQAKCFTVCVIHLKCNVPHWHKKRKETHFNPVLLSG